jgi:tight adherence protein B
MIGRRGWRRRRRERAGPPIEAVAAIAQRLAVLLSAGVAPHSAWGYLGAGDSGLGVSDGDSPGAGSTGSGALDSGSLDSGATDLSAPGSNALGSGAPGSSTTGPRRASARTPPSNDEITARIVDAAAVAGRRGEGVAAAIAGEARLLGGQIGDAWLALAGAWEVATQAGAPLASSLRQLASTFREVGQLHRTVEVALTGPTATARMMMALPVVGILFGGLMGFDSVHTLFFTVPGLLCLVIGGALMLLGHLWNGRLMRTARARNPAPGLELDLMAIAMTGGGSLERARELVRSALADFDLPVQGDGTALDRVLLLSGRAGVPAAELLRSEADEQRRNARSAGERRAEGLSVTLMMPLGLCVLPAFMLVAVVPLLLAVLSSTLRTI